MKTLLLLTGAAALGVAVPAVAASGDGHGGGGHAMMAAHGPSMHANMQAGTHGTGMHANATHGPGMHANAHATTHATHHATHARNSHATAHARNAHATTHGISTHDQALAHKYGGALCPPGLYKKTPSCMPPGQAKRLFHTGQRVPVNYKYITPFSDIPTALVSQYDLTDQYRYIYRNNMIYVIDPTTNLITRIINAVL